MDRVSFTDTFTYDANGNMTCRIENGVTYTHAYNAENRASSIAKRNGGCATGTILESWSFAYDGDGNRVTTAHFTGTSGTPDTTTRYYFGGSLESTDGTVTKYYSFAGQTVAMKEGTTFKYLVSDHLGSTSLVLSASGTILEQQRYLPFGAPRTIPSFNNVTSTDFTYTGQRKLDDGMGGILDYKARFYSPYLNQFTQPDTIVSNPYNPQAWNRYAYVRNNPIRYNDPDGHAPCKPGYRCTTPIADRRDLTTWLVAAAVDIAESPEMQSVNKALSEQRYIDAKNEFESVVKDGAKYDVKDKMLEQFRGDPIKIGNNWYEYSTAGNILYGFYGKAAGWSDFALYAGAGKAQFDDWRRDEGDLGPIGPPYYGDTMDDHFAVKFGIYLYDNYYAEDGALTTIDLLDAFETYKYPEWMAVRPKPKDFQPRYYEYPVNRFYQDKVEAI